MSVLRRGLRSPPPRVGLGVPPRAGASAEGRRGWREGAGGRADGGLGRGRPAGQGVSCVRVAAWGCRARALSSDPAWRCPACLRPQPRCPPEGAGPLSFLCLQEPAVWGPPGRCRRARGWELLPLAVHPVRDQGRGTSAPHSPTPGPRRFSLRNAGGRAGAAGSGSQGGGNRPPVSSLGPTPIGGAGAGGHAQGAFGSIAFEGDSGADSGRAGAGGRLFLCGFRGAGFLRPKSRAGQPRRGLGWAGGPVGVAGLVGRRAQGWLSSAPCQTPRLLHPSDELEVRHRAGTCGSVVPGPRGGQRDGDKPWFGGTWDFGRGTPGRLCGVGGQVSRRPGAVTRLGA